MTSQTHGRAIIATMKWKTHKTTGTYEITELDRDMLVRASAHEGAPHAEIVRTLIQRFAWLHPRYYKRMEDMVQAYVQPINPKWFPYGVKLKREVARLRRNGSGAAAKDQERRAKLRVGYASQPLSKIEGRYHTYVNRVLEDTADWSNIIGAIHYRAGRGKDDADGQSLALDFAEDKESGWFSIDAGHGFKAGTTWFFGVGSSRRLEVSTELVSEPEEQDQGSNEQGPEDSGISHKMPSREHLSKLPTIDLIELTGVVTEILAERAKRDGC